MSIRSNNYSPKEYHAMKNNISDIDPAANNCFSIYTSNFIKMVKEYKKVEIYDCIANVLYKTIQKFKQISAQGTNYNKISIMKQNKRNFKTQQDYT